VMAANFSAKALGTFSGDGMMALDCVVEVTLLQNNRSRPNTPKSQRASWAIALRRAAMACA
jgi:hypothetical protein